MDTQYLPVSVKLLVSLFNFYKYKMTRITTAVITSEKTSRRLTKTSAFAYSLRTKSGQKNIYCITRCVMPDAMSTNEVGQGEEHDEMVELRRCVQTEE